MTIRPGFIDYVIEDNIQREMMKGKSQRQAIAIAYEEARRHWKEVYPNKKLPANLQNKGDSYLQKKMTR